VAGGRCSNCLPGSRPSNIWTRGTYFEGLLAFYRITRNRRLPTTPCSGARFMTGSCAAVTPTCRTIASARRKATLNFTSSTHANEPAGARHQQREQLGRQDSVARVTYVDAIHMSLPLFAKLSVVTGNTNYAAKMYAYFNYTKTSLRLWNANDHLWYRDANFLANYTASDGTQQKVIGRAATAGRSWRSPGSWTCCPQTIRTTPSICKPSRKWPQRSSSCNAPTASGTSTSATQRLSRPGDQRHGDVHLWTCLGINHGHLDANTYLPAAINGWNALATGALHHTSDATTVSRLRAGHR